MTTRQPPTDKEKQFAFSVPATFSMDGTADQKKRKFSGVAYSGDVIPNHYYWGSVIFDLSTMSVPSKLPALIDHDRAARCGFATSFSISNDSGLTVAGDLMSNEHGKAVAAESDEGFPWQMSVHISPGSIEEIKAGFSAVVNGRELSGPLTVFRNSRISEVSFTATGWDSNTSAVAMSQGGDQPQGETAMDLKQLQDRVAALEAEKITLQASKETLETQLKDANDKLVKYSNDARDSPIKQLSADIGKEFAADNAEVKAFSTLPQEAFDGVAKMLREQFKKPAPVQNGTQVAALFSHVAAGGSAPAATTTPVAENPLLAHAKARADQFAKRQA